MALLKDLLVTGNTRLGGSVNVSDEITATNFCGPLEGNASSATTLTGLTATVTELNYTDGVTSNIQTQLNGKLSLSGGTLTGNLTGQYITGTWLQNTSNTDLGSAASKFVVQDASGWLYYRTAAETLSDIGANNASNITSGTLPLARGGTGASLTRTNNAIIRYSSAGDYFSSTATASGAFYATSADGAPKFGTLPVAQGGTGSTSASGARGNLGTPTVFITSSTPTATHTGDIWFIP